MGALTGVACAASGVCLACVEPLEQIMPVEAIKGAAGFQDVLESGSVILANGETAVRLGIGSFGGKLLLEYDPAITSLQAGTPNDSGLVHYRFPRVGMDQVLDVKTAFSLGTENFRLTLQIRGVEAGSSFSSLLSYTLQLT